jgi:hypothetical protein
MGMILVAPAIASFECKRLIATTNPDREAEGQKTAGRSSKDS